MITIAPEFPYLGNYQQVTSYHMIINQLTEIYNYLDPQFYNQGTDGFKVITKDQNLFPKLKDTDWLRANNKTLPSIFLYLITQHFINPNYHDFIHLNPHHFTIGLLASKILNASDGYTTPVQIKQTSQYFKTTRLNPIAIKGLMD